MKKIQLAAAALALAGALASAPATAGVVFSFSPSASHVNVGGSVQVQMRVSGLASEILSAYDLNFQWDSSLLRYTAASFTPVQSQLGGAFEHVADSTAQGNYGVQGVSYLGDAALAGVQLNDFLFGSFTFTGLGNGVATLTLGTNADFERNFVGNSFQTLDVSVGSACIGVGNGACAVPEPGSLGLVGAALAGAFGVPALRRRRVAAAAQA